VRKGLGAEERWRLPRGKRVSKIPMDGRLGMDGDLNFLVCFGRWSLAWRPKEGCGIGAQGQKKKLQQKGPGRREGY